METFERAQATTLGERLAEEPHRLISLFGPRQAGKTTIVRQALRKIGRTPRKYLAVVGRGRRPVAFRRLRGTRL